MKVEIYDQVKKKSVKVDKRVADILTKSKKSKYSIHGPDVDNRMMEAGSGENGYLVKTTKKRGRPKKEK